MEQEAEEVEEIRAPNLPVPGESEQPADDLPFFCGCKSYEFASAQTLLSHMIRAHGLSPSGLDYVDGASHNLYLTRIRDEAREKLRKLMRKK